MERKTVAKAFRECKKMAGLDFSYSRAIEDCNTCTWAAIEEKHGEAAKGIFLKYFTFGMNREEWDERAPYYIAHDLTAEQARKVVETLSEYFAVEWDGSEAHCIKISDKAA